MKTKYLLLEAATQSEWDPASFALFPVTEERVNKFKALAEKVKELEAMGVFSLTILSDEVEYYTSTEDLPEQCVNDDGEVKEGIYELDKDEVQGYCQPEQTLKYGEIRINIYGSITFATTGKHSGEEFWCDTTLAQIDD